MIGFRWITMNVRDNPDLSRANVKKCGVIADSHSKPGAIVMGQEIGEREDHVDVSAGLGVGWHEHGRYLTENPIWFRTGLWTLCKPEDLDHKFDPEAVVPTHGGLEHVTPHRDFNYVFVKTRDPATKKLIIVCVINSHFVSSAWSLKRVSMRAWRKSKWNLHWSKMNVFIDKVEAAGYTVLVGGDWNRSSALGVKKFSTRQTWVYGSGLDRLAFIPGKGVTVKVVRKFSLKTPSDHKAKGVDLHIE